MQCCRNTGVPAAVLHCKSQHCKYGVGDECAFAAGTVMLVLESQPCSRCLNYCWRGIFSSVLICLTSFCTQPNEDFSSFCFPMNLCNFCQWFFAQSVSPFVTLDAFPPNSPAGPIPHPVIFQGQGIVTVFLYILHRGDIQSVH